MLCAVDSGYGQILFFEQVALIYNGEIFSKMSDLIEKPIYVCGDYRVDVRRRRLYENEDPVTVTAKAFDVLVALIARGGEVVSKDELMKAAWVDTIVEENNLTQQISALRRIFRDRAGDHRYIATVPGRGYSFVASVSRLQPQIGPEVLVAGSTTSSITIDISERPAVDRSWRLAIDPAALRGTAIAVVYILLVCLPAFILGSGDLSGNRAQSVGVLTFRSIGVEDDRYSAGIGDTLRAKLGSLEDITVRPAPGSLPDSDTLAAGRRLDVDLVLAGSIQRENGRIRVAIEMIDVRAERIVWGKTFDDDVSNVFSLQDAIAAEVVDRLRFPLRPKSSSSPVPRPRSIDLTLLPA